MICLQIHIDALKQKSGLLEITGKILISQIIPFIPLLGKVVNSLSHI